MKYHTIPMAMKDSTYWLAAVIEDVFGDMLEKEGLQFFADNFICVARNIEEAVTFVVVDVKNIILQ